MIRLARASDPALLPEIEASAAEAFDALDPLALDGGAPSTPAEGWVGALGAGTLWVVEGGAGGSDRPVGFLGAERVLEGLGLGLG